MVRRLTLIAGEGGLVPIMVDAARRAGDALQILDLAGRTDLPPEHTQRARLSDAGAVLDAIRAFRTSHVLMAGGIHISDADRKGIARALGPVGALAGGLGDIGLAGAMLLFARLQRLRLIGAHELAPELVAPSGQIAGPVIDGRAQALCRAALGAARSIGAIDLGQSIVMAGTRAVAAEDASGTDALLERVARMRDDGLIGNGGDRLILAKARKPRQPSFVDLPAIGPDTVSRAARAGIGIIAVEAGASLLIDRPALAATAQEFGISIVGARHG